MKFSKILFMISLCNLSTLAFATTVKPKLLGSKICVAERIRTDIPTWVEARIEFQVRELDDARFMDHFIGHIFVGHPGLGPFEGYYAIFNYSDVKENLKYRPDTYKDHYQFPRINSKHSTLHDGGNMRGYFVLKKDLTEAHYVFRAGDHIGGAIDFRCH